MRRRFDMLIQSQIDRYLDRCHFTDLERRVFIRRCAGQSIEHIADYEYISMSTVARTINKILKKMELSEKE